MNYEKQRDNILFLKIDKTIFKDKAILKNEVTKNWKEWIINDKAEKLRGANNKIL